ncbi:RNA-directed DNA polymerase from mobile element jockey isoform X1 [Nothobranchius furzeri]|uniref:RNA-directed DNA polymerase from mobile element jockey isoform X1 n=1 Tax=Nothobranchius furzeri TaxID=105023 RepID=UPI00390485A9
MCEESDRDQLSFTEDGVHLPSADSLLVYDRDFLLSIRSRMDDFQNSNAGHLFPPPLETDANPAAEPVLLHAFPPPLETDVSPASGLVLPVGLPLPRRPWKKKRGKRGGFFVQLRRIRRGEAISERCSVTVMSRIHRHLNRVELISLLPGGHGAECYMDVSEVWMTGQLGAHGAESCASAWDVGMILQLGAHGAKRCMRASEPRMIRRPTAADQLAAHNRGRCGDRLITSDYCVWGKERCFRSSPDARGGCLVPVVSLGSTGLPSRSRFRRSRFGRHNQRGINLANLQYIARFDGAGLSLPSGKQSTRFALINARSVGNKTFILKEFFLNNSLSVLCATESWLTPGDSAAIVEMLPPGCSFINIPRAQRRGGGLLTIFKSDLVCTPITHQSTPLSFELSLFELGRSPPLLCALIYRPPPYNKDFLNEFANFLADVSCRYGKILLLGDFNIHVCCPDKPLVKDFLDLIDSFSMSQRVNGPTHGHTHTLDLIFCHGLQISDLGILPATFSDHSPVVFNMNLDSASRVECFRPSFSRTIGPNTAAHFAAILALNSAPFQSTDEFTVVEGLLHALDSSCLAALDIVAPLKSRRNTSRPDPWLNEQTRSMRQHARRLERKWIKDRLTVSFESMREAWSQYQRAVRGARNRFFASIVTANSNNQGVLYKTMNAVLSPVTKLFSSASADLCNQILQFFLNKISVIRAQIHQTNHVPDSVIPPHVQLQSFQPISLPYLEKTVAAMKPSGSPEDVIPPRLLKEVFPFISHNVLDILNSSLTLAEVPSAFKHAVLQPILKKPGLDPTDYSNLRPISKLPFLSKVLEKIVYEQMLTHLNDNQVMDIFQSGFRKQHSTETAHVRVFNDIFLALDSGFHVVLLLLDLSAAFDTIDHNILITRLQTWAGISGSALDWFRSYFYNRSARVMLDGCSSESQPLRWGVPQGSILGPLLFNLYILPLGAIFRRHAVSYHLYADDCQIYFSFKPTQSMQVLSDCIDNVKLWLADNFLHLNDSKTEVIVFNPHSIPATHQPDLNYLSPNVSTVISNLGVKIDQALKMDAQVNNTVKSCFYHLRRISKLKHILSVRLLKSVVHTFITSRLDYSNSCLYGISKAAQSRLQLVQNSAARFLTGVDRRQHITPILKSLHWLPVHLRINFKIMLLTYKSLNSQAPPYLCELVHYYNPPRALRSEDKLLLALPNARLKSRGERAFSVCAPKLWNALPLLVRQAPTISIFKSRMKTHYFNLAYNT